MSDTDRIEKQITIKASRARVWQALVDSQQFGKWFGMELDGPFVAGEPIVGRMTHPDHWHVPCHMLVERIEPERLFSYRWHPYEVEVDGDFTREPTTLVEFTLAEVAGGTHLTIVESGFDAVPQALRAEAYRRNAGGWQIQAGNIERHVLASL